jgi:hypothetical protein
VRVKPIRELAIIALMFLLVEVLVRVMVGAGWLGSPYGQWPRKDYPASVAMIEDQQPDVIVVGNSRVIGSFNPAIFDQIFRNETGQTIHSFNAGHGGTSIELLGPLIRYFYTPAAPDATVILGISPLDMGSNNSTWNAEAAAFIDTPEVRAAMGRSRFNVRASINDLWYTFAYRHGLGEMIQNLRAPRMVLQNRDSLGYQYDRTVMDVEDTRQNFVIEDLAVNEDYPQRISDPSREALIDLMQHSDGRLIVVNVPVYISILPGYEDYDPIYRQLWPQIEALCAECDVPCWDFQYLVDEGTLTAQHFANPTHVNGDGALIFTAAMSNRYAEHPQ